MLIAALVGLLAVTIIASCALYWVLRDIGDNVRKIADQRKD